MAPAVDWLLPPEERALGATLLGRWRDLLYAPGPGFSEELEPGVFRASLVVVTASGACRITSRIQPAFGGELSRLRLERLPGPPAETFGSFFEVERRGFVYTMGEDRTRSALRPTDRADWAYAGASLAARLGEVREVRVLRERVRGRDHDVPFAWQADRGLVLTGATGERSLVLAEPHDPERAAFAPTLGPYRALVDAGAPVSPGAGPRELLGHGDRADIEELLVEQVPLSNKEG